MESSGSQAGEAGRSAELVHEHKDGDAFQGDEAPVAERKASDDLAEARGEGECANDDSAELKVNEVRDTDEITLSLEDVGPGTDALEEIEDISQLPPYINSTSQYEAKKPSLFGNCEGAVEGAAEAEVENIQSGQILQVLSLGKLRWGQDPQIFCCPYCQKEDFSANHYEHTPLVWTGAGILCAMGCWLGCCLIPFCLDNLKNVRHTCPSCGRVVGLRRACRLCQSGTHVVCCCGRDEFLEYLHELDANAGREMEQTGNQRQPQQRV